MTPKILIVDDSIFMRNIIKNIILNNGMYKIFEAADGVECLKKYTEHKPDLVFLDIMMPNKTGIEALKEIKKHDHKAKIVIVTTLQIQKDFDEIKYGVTGHINKPFEKEDIIKALKDNLNLKWKKDYFNQSQR